MTKDDWSRAFSHTWVGGIAGALTMIHAPSGIALFAGELVYELFNDWRKQDSSYKDVLGLVWGYGIAVGGVILWIFWRNYA